MEKRPLTLDELRQCVGKEVGLAEWRVVTQDMIDQFAESTDDHQFLHVDPERAALEGPFGGTIAHGFLTLALLSPMAFEALPGLVGSTMGINYGFDKVRFLSPVKTGSRVRARFVLTHADIRKSGRVLNTYEVSMEIENTINPAFKATWLTLNVVEVPAG